jgi:hypothetical protein
MWENGRFLTKSEVDKTNTFAGKRGALEKELGKCEMHFPKFWAWVVREVPVSERGDEQMDMLIYMWVRELSIAASSQRTYFLTTLGEWARRRNMRFPTTPRLQQIKKNLKENMAGVKQKRALTMRSSELASAISNFAETVQGWIQLAFLTAARVGNLQGLDLRNMKKVGEEMHLTYTWLNHKTHAQIGQKTLKITFPHNEFNMAQKWISANWGAQSKIDCKQIDEALKVLGLTRHSIRRSSPRYWSQERNKPIPEVMMISLHTTITSLMAYLDFDDEQED